MTDNDEDWMGMKAAQMGFTEVCLNRALYTIDIKRLNVLYILPAKTPDATDFSADRFDGALELSPHLAELFSDVKNIGHKRAGSVSLYLRGARSRSGLKSIPAALTVFDEFSEMAKEKVILAEERSSGQTYTQDIRISTPLLPKDNIDEEFTNSSQGLFSYKCPHCTQWQILEHDNCFSIAGEHVNDPDIKRSYYFCPNCKVPLPHEEKPKYFRQDNTQWVHGRTSYIKKGYRIPQHYSFDLEPWKLARLIMKAQQDPAAEAELWNSKYGLAKEVSGARISGDDYENAKQLNRNSGVYPENLDFIVIGIDVGTWFHIVVNAVTVRPDDWDHKLDSFASACNVATLMATKVKDADEVIAILNKYKPLAYCIDAYPEQRASKKITDHAPGRGYRVQYAHDRTCSIATVRDDLIIAGRTFWLDTLRNRFTTGTISLPRDITREHKDHFQNVVKHYSRTDSGEYQAKYLAQGADHYFHAANYAEIAIRATLFDAYGKPESLHEDI